MELSETKKKEYIKRLLLSRMRILINHGFYGLLLMHMRFALNETIGTAATDGMHIYFAPSFLDDLSDSELDFVLMHEIMHVVLKHCLRGEHFDKENFNIACDIVVNSNILKSNNNNPASITLKKYGESMHIAPDGKEGYEYTAEQVYAMLKKSNDPGDKLQGKSTSIESGGTTMFPSNASGLKSDSMGSGNQISSNWDNHTKWDKHKSDKKLWDQWSKHLSDAVKAIEIRDPSNARGLIPLAAQRLLHELRHPQLDWRTILTDFVQEDIVDYSFSPPDRRFDDNPFYLPDFNEKDEKVADILFMIDTSGSVSDDMVTMAYSEIKGAIDQFNGRLEGWLGFFDSAVVEPVPFVDEDEFMSIKPQGGGGTSFDIIFDYIRDFMMDEPPASIIILTDGYAPFPDEAAAQDIPVLWIINNDDITPPWGRIARIKI